MKVAFSHFHPDKVIASIRKAGGEELGEKIEAAGHTKEARGVLVQKLSAPEGSQGCTEMRLQPGPPLLSSVFSLTGCPILFCTFEVIYAKFELSFHVFATAF